MMLSIISNNYTITVKLFYFINIFPISLKKNSCKQLLLKNVIPKFYFLSLEGASRVFGGLSPSPLFALLNCSQKFWLKVSMHLYQMKND